MTLELLKSKTGRTLIESHRGVDYSLKYPNAFRNMRLGVIDK